MDIARVQEISYNNITPASLMRGFMDFPNNDEDLVKLAKAIDSYIQLYANYGSCQCIFEIPVSYLKHIDSMQKVLVAKGYKIEAIAGAFLISWEKEKENVGRKQD